MTKFKVILIKIVKNWTAYSNEKQVSVRKTVGPVFVVRRDNYFIHFFVATI
jgi:hypothetical protein